MRKLLLTIIIILALAGMAFAHQPRIVESDWTDIQNPEISQAFYGDLGGTYHFYRIVSDKEFELYVQLMLPYEIGARKDTMVIIGETNKTLVAVLEGSGFKWEKFHEGFARDDYYSGPELSKRVKAGEYWIWVQNTDNKGKYVLAVGKEEKFSIKDIASMIATLPKMKTFLGKPEYTSFLNRIGILIAASIITAALLILAIAKLIKSARKAITKRKEKKKKKFLHHRRHSTHTATHRRLMRP